MVSLINDPFGIDTGVLIAFGNSTQIPVVNPLILDGIGVGPLLFDYAFVVPRTGTITSFAAYFRTLVGAIAPATIRASIYQASGPFSDTFALVFSQTLAPTSSLATPNSFGLGSPISIPVGVGDKLFVVFDIDPSSVLALTVTGWASAGLEIS